MHQCNSPDCVKWKWAPCKKLQRENSACRKRPVTKAQVEVLVEQLSLNWECGDGTELVDVLWSHCSSLKLKVTVPVKPSSLLGCVCSPFCRENKRGACWNLHFPASPVPPQLCLKPWKSKAETVKLWISPGHSVGLSKSLQQDPKGVSSASSSEGQKQIPGQSDRFQDSFPPAALHLKAHLLPHLLQNSENNVPFSVFFSRGDTKALGPWWSEDMHRPSAGEWCVGKIEPYQGKINKFCLESSQQNAGGFKKQSLIAEQYVWTWFCLAKLSLGSRKAK